MDTILAPIKKTDEVKKESAELVIAYIAFMCECDPSEEMEIEEYIRIHGSKEYNEWWDAEKERIKRAWNNCQLKPPLAGWFFRGRTGKDGW